MTEEFTKTNARLIFPQLLRSGVNMKSYNGQWSWQKNVPKYAIRAQELANWLASPANPLYIRVEKYSGSEVFNKISGRRGIIFFQNYWGPGNQGDHIDLWNGSRLTDWRTLLTIHIYGESYSKSDNVWFWEVP